MNEELKNLIEQLGTLVMVENNKPRFIVLSYSKFRELVSPVLKKELIHKSIDNSGNFDKDNSETLSVSDYHAERDEEITDRLNKEILALKEQVAEKEKELSSNL